MSTPSKFMGEEVGRREAFVEVEVDAAGTGVEAELAICLLYTSRCV